MSVSTIKTVIQWMPKRTGAWAFHVVLGLIWTIATGTAISNGLGGNPFGDFAIGALAGATLFAFCVAYVEASELDRREEER